MRRTLINVLILATTAVVILPKEAHVSQALFSDISLVDLSKTSSLILQAVYRKSKMEEKDGGHEFEVVGAYSPASQEIAAKRRIRIWQKSAEAWGRIRRAHDETGIRESLYVPSLEKNAPRRLVDGRTYIVFLDPGVREGEFVFAAENAFVDPNRFEEFRDASPALVWPGQAQDAKAGAHLHLENKTSAYIEGLSAWPESIAGKQVTATGLMVRKKIIPDPDPAGGLMTQGARGSQWVLKNCRWRLK